jgi:hypothetical protein
MEDSHRDDCLDDGQAVGGPDGDFDFFPADLPCLAFKAKQPDIDLAGIQEAADFKRAVRCEDLRGAVLPDFRGALDFNALNINVFPDTARAGDGEIPAGDGTRDLARAVDLKFIGLQVAFDCAGA